MTYSTDTSFVQDSTIYLCVSGISCVGILEGHENNIISKGSPRWSVFYSPIKNIGLRFFIKRLNILEPKVSGIPIRERVRGSKTQSSRSERADSSKYHHSKQIMGKAKETQKLHHAKKFLWPIFVIQIHNEVRCCMFFADIICVAKILTFLFHWCPDLLVHRYNLRGFLHLEIYF